MSAGRWWVLAAWVTLVACAVPRDPAHAWRRALFRNVLGRAGRRHAALRLRPALLRGPTLGDRAYHGPMITVWTDFNAESPDGACWLLKYDGEDLDAQLPCLGLRGGDIVVLTQDGDFTVRARLELRFEAMLGRTALVAVPDWASLRFSEGSGEGGAGDRRILR